MADNKWFVFMCKTNGEGFADKVNFVKKKGT